MNAPDIRRPGFTPTRIMPESYEDVRAIAREAVLAGLFRVPDGTPKEVAEAQCLFAIMTGLDAGMTPAQAVQAIYVKDGKCNITGQGCLALIWGAGFRVDQTHASEATGWTASCTITRPHGETVTREYSRADAIRAGLWRDEPDLSSTWWTAQIRMLDWRAVGRAAADGAPDVLRGLHILELTTADAEARESRAVPAQEQLPDVPDDLDQDRAYLDGVVNDVWSAKKHLSGLKEVMAAVRTTEQLDHLWDSHLEETDGKLSEAEDAQAQALYDAAAKRLG